MASYIRMEGLTKEYRVYGGKKFKAVDNLNLEHPAYVNHMLAHSYQRSGRLRKSLEEWGRIVEANPDDETAAKHHRRLKELLP